jgi:hypothetical protein
MFLYPFQRCYCVKFLRTIVVINTHHGLNIRKKIKEGKKKSTSTNHAPRQRQSAYSKLWKCIFQIVHRDRNGEIILGMGGPIFLILPVSFNYKVAFALESST